MTTGTMTANAKNENPDYDVIVVGAGLVGATFALKLAATVTSKKLRIAVVEASPFQAREGDGFDPRVVALTDASKRLLASIGVWESIVAERVCPYHKMHVWEADGTGAIDFDCAEVRQSSLGYIVENSVVLEQLNKKMAEHKAITQFCPAKVTGVNLTSSGNSSVTLDGGVTLKSQLVVAADGARSPIREMCGLKLREWPYNHHAIVTTITTEKSHEFTARQRFMPSGPLAFLPLQTRDNNTQHCSIVWSQTPEVAKQIMAMDDESFCREVEKAGEFCLGKVTAANKRFSFPLYQRHAVDYVKPGLALVGDAAHTIHPLAGQGVNLGFQDCIALAQEVGRASESGVGLGSALVLGRYQRRCKPRNLGMMAAMEGFKRLFAEETLPVRLIRNMGMAQVNKLTPLKNQIIRKAIGINS